MDLVLAFLCFLLTLFLVLSFFHGTVEQTVQRFDSLELERNAIFLADSLIKSRDETNPQYGSAVFSSELHRVKANEIDLALLAQISATQQAENSRVYFQTIELKFENGSQMIFDNSSNGDCLSVERFVLANKQKAVLRMVICHD